MGYTCLVLLSYDRYVFCVTICCLFVYFIVIQNFLSFKALFGILLSFMPESPVWLRSQHRYREARNSLVWLKLPPPTRTSLPPSPLSIEKDIELTRTEDDVKSTETKSNFFTRPVLMPLGIGLSLLVLQQISGIDAIVFFTVEIFHASGTQKRRK